MLAAAALLSVSCQKAFNEGGVSPDGTATVSVSLSFPTIQTRAYSDGTTATKLQYAVYEGGSGSTLKKIAAYTKTDETINISKKVDFQLVTGRTYTFVFWAGAPSEENGWESPYAVNFEDGGATMEADYTSAVANDERYDAFFASVEKTITGDVQMSVELTRPFAQINVGTSDYDIAEAQNAAPDLSQVVVNSAYTKLNLVTGEATESASVTFGFNTIATEEMFPIKGYEYLAMAYVLASTKDEADKTVSFSYKKEEDDNITIRTVGSVPVQRNHRTNMFGQVLTSTASVNVIIVPEYEEPDYNYDQLLFAAAVGGTAVLEDDVTLPEGEKITFTRDAVVDMNGKTVTGTVDGVFTAVGEDTNLTIKGNGTMNSTNKDADILVWADNGATITIEDGTFNGQDDEMIYIGTGGGTIYIKGGTFKCDDFKYTLNCFDAAARNETAKFVVTGGKFWEFDPSASAAEGTPLRNWVPAGYKSVETTIDGETWYVVVPDNTVEIEAPTSGETSRAITDAIKDFKNSTETELTILLSQPGSYSLKSVSNSQQLDWPSDKKLTFIGTGKDVVLTDGDWVSAATGYEVEIRDLTLKVFENGSNHTSLGFPGAAKVTMTNVDVYGELDIKSGVVTITNCNFYYAGGAANTRPRWGIYFNGPATATIAGCTFDNSCKKNEGVETQGVCVTGGWNETSATAVGDIEIRDCEFKVSGGKPQKALVHITSDFAKSCGTVTIANTTFEGYEKLWEEVDNDTANNPTQKYKVFVDGEKVQ